MSSIACFCGRLHSFDGDAGACPGCGEAAVILTGVPEAGMTTAIRGISEDGARSEPAAAVGSAVVLARDAGAEPVLALGAR